MTRVALVTGGASGIGAAVARRLDRDGWRIVVADVDVPAGRQIAADLSQGRFQATDVASEADIAALVDSIEREEGRLDGLVSNAGVNVRRPVADLALADWNRVIATNLTAAFLLARAAAPMLRRAHGAMVTIASTRAHMSEPDTEAYAASKGGLVALTHALSISLAPQIRVNCISPGWIHIRGEAPRPDDHAEHPAGRVGVPDDVAALAAFLLGPESGFATGAEFILDGGMTRKMIYRE